MDEAYLSPIVRNATVFFSPVLTSSLTMANANPQASCSKCYFIISSLLVQLWLWSLTNMLEMLVYYFPSCWPIHYYGYFCGLVGLLEMPSCYYPVIGPSIDYGYSCGLTELLEMPSCYCSVIGISIDYGYCTHE
jgi:hypothetical protein